MTGRPPLAGRKRDLRHPLASTYAAGAMIARRGFYAATAQNLRAVIRDVQSGSPQRSQLALERLSQMARLFEDLARR